jgi:hypothetical protein
VQFNSCENAESYKGIFAFIAWGQAEAV